MKPAALALMMVVAAAQPKLIDAKLETRAPRGSLAQEVAGIDGPAWIAYQVRSIPGERYSCDTQEWRDEWRNRAAPPPQPVPARLEGFRETYVFIRVENRQVTRLRTFTPDCEVDGGGLAVIWLTGVAPAQSIAFLKGFANEERGKYSEGAVTAIALHSAPEADAALEDLLGASHSDKVRRKAAFWLGSSRRQRGVELLSPLLHNDPSDGFRQHVAYALSQSKEGVPVLIEFARKPGSDKKVREKAMFWLARSPEPEAKRFIDEVLSR